MKIYQGYVTAPMKPFGFLEQYKLEEYRNHYQPVVMFGCYRSRQARLFLRNHKGQLVIFWMGADSWEIKEDMVLKGFVLKKHVINVTTIPRIQQYLQLNGVPCKLVKIVAQHKPKPLKKGDCVYTYMNRSKPDYHGKQIVDQIKTDYEIITGDGSYTKNEWKEGQADIMYRKSFIGLFLSDFVGGGISIQEMGLRGIPVVTNVLDLPHCHSWKTVEDVEKIINQQSKGIGTVNKKLAEQVYESLEKEVDCFNLHKLLV